MRLVRIGPTGPCGARFFQDFPEDDNRCGRETNKYIERPLIMEPYSLPPCSVVYARLVLSANHMLATHSHRHTCTYTYTDSHTNTHDFLSTHPCSYTHSTLTHTHTHTHTTEPVKKFSRREYLHVSLDKHYIFSQYYWNQSKTDK